MLEIWSLVPLPFLKPAWTSGNSRFMYCWSLVWRILNITLLALRWVPSCGILIILWHCFSLELEWKLIFCSPVTTAELTDEFSKFAGILSAALTASSSFRISNSSTGIPSPPVALFIVMLSKAHLTSHSRMSGSSSVITPSWLSGHEDLFCTVLLCILATSS